MEQIREREFQKLENELLENVKEFAKQTEQEISRLKNGKNKSKKRKRQSHQDIMDFLQEEFLKFEEEQINWINSLCRLPALDLAFREARRRLRFRLRIYLFLTYQRLMSKIHGGLVEKEVCSGHSFCNFWQLRMVEIMQHIAWASLRYGAPETERVFQNIVRKMNIGREKELKLRRRMLQGVQALNASRIYFENKDAELTVFVPEPVLDAKYAIDLFLVRKSEYRSAIKQILFKLLGLKGENESLEDAYRRLQNINDKARKTKQALKHVTALLEKVGTKEWIDAIYYFKQNFGIDLAQYVSAVQVKSQTNPHLQNIPERMKKENGIDLYTHSISLPDFYANQRGALHHVHGDDEINNNFARMSKALRPSYAKSSANGLLPFKMHYIVWASQESLDMMLRFR